MFETTGNTDIGRQFSTPRLDPFLNNGVTLANFHSFGKVSASFDPMHKWLPIKNSLVSIKISQTNLVFELIIQKNFNSFGIT